MDYVYDALQKSIDITLKGDIMYVLAIGMLKWANKIQLGKLVVLDWELEMKEVIPW